MLDVPDVVGLFQSIELTEPERIYLDGQSKRLAYLVNLVQRYSDAIGGPLSILDVGPHFLTRCLMELVTPQPRMSTLGYPFPKLYPDTAIVHTLKVDFNDLPDKLDVEEQSFDLITCCEVVEHLFTPPSVMLSKLAPLVKKQGRIIVGTPNAARIEHRVQMMLGQNPFHRLTPDWRSGAAHIREYTMAEMKEYGTQASLITDFDEYVDYWGHAMYIPNIDELKRDNPSYRGGMTIVFRSGE